MKKIYLVRHCKAVGQQPESPLTEEGSKDASSLIVDFFMGKGIEKIISSPYLRAIDTIKPFSIISNTEIKIDERLMERVLSTSNLEDWLIKLEETYEDLELKFEGGESSSEAIKRGIQLINEIVEMPENNIILVTHGALLSLIIMQYNQTFGFKDWQDMKNPEIYCLEVEQNGIRLNHLL